MDLYAKYVLPHVLPGALSALMFVCGRAAASEYVDRDAVFARAMTLAVSELDLDAGDLQPFSLVYGLTLLETGIPEGAFEITLLIRSSRRQTGDLDLGVYEPEERERVSEMFEEVERIYSYRTAIVRFSEEGDAHSAMLSSIQLNADPDALSVEGRSEPATGAN